MGIRIEEIVDKKKKSLYAEEILKKLPDWFGNEKALNDYVEKVANLPFWAAFDDDKCLGFISAKIHYKNTGDIFVCGVLPDYHNMGIGRKLIKIAEEYFVQNDCKYMIVKTLSENAHYEPYEKTRLFYTKVGFEPLITLTEMWDEENPCLIMIKKL